MVKMVLHDWRSGWKQAWKELWIGKTVGFNLLVACSEFGSWAGIYRDFPKCGKIALIIQHFMIPIVIFFHAMYPNRLSRPMYMAPLEKKEKKKYLFTALKIKVISITILQCGINFFLTGAGWLPVISAVFITVSMFLFNLTISFQTNFIETGWDVMVFIMFLINYIVIVWMGDAPMESWEIILACITFGFQLIACVANIKKQYKNSMEKALDYERAYVIRKKKA